MTRPATTRIAFLDGLRGVAVMCVVATHVLSGALTTMSPTAGAVAFDGYVGVQIFFVISGFAIAHSLSRARISTRASGVFLLRRICRLDPPYWASIVVVYAVALLADAVLRRTTVVFPSPLAILVHVCYLQNILGVRPIQDVYWSLCYEIQFYILLVILLGIKERLAAIWDEAWAFLIVFSPLLIYSVLVSTGIAPAPGGSCFGEWYSFFAGVALQRVVARGDWRMFGVAMAAAIIVGARSLTGATTVLAAGAIALAYVLDKLQVWLAGPTWQFLGRISYSLYLTHVPFGGTARNLFARAAGPRPVAQVLAACLAVGAAIGFAAVFWRVIEAPSLALSQWVSRRARPAIGHDRATR